MINLKNIEQQIEKYFPTHPFSVTGVSRKGLRTLLRNYFAMSQAFPYIQAGSQKELVFHHVAQNKDIPTHVEMTTVVGNFLAWDETGGFYTLLRKGLPGLPDVLNTNQFHSNILREDLKRIYGESITPEYSQCTKEYLNALYKGLSSLNPIERIAYMVSFELHAQRMITTLWKTLHESTGLKKEDLVYFHIHVGGDDPAEAYHVAMTQKLVDNVVDEEKEEMFMIMFLNAYETHVEWCRSISCSEEIEVSEMVGKLYANK